MTDRKCNGWTNRDTWAFALWVDNTELSYKTRFELCKTIAESGLDREDMDTALSQTLRDNASTLLIISKFHKNSGIHY